VNLHAAGPAPALPSRDRAEILPSGNEDICVHWGSLEARADLEVAMPLYRDPDATGRLDEITVIEDPEMVEEDADGVLWPSFAFIDRLTIRAHPVIIDCLLEGTERLWSLEEVLTDLDQQ